MNTKGTWIDDTMNSLNMIMHAQADSDLFLKVQARLRHPESKTRALRKIYYWPVAAGIAALISLNIFTAFHYNHSQKQSHEIPDAVATDYLSYLRSINL
jgi:thiosulfate reductase cytochrome b subunit